MSQGSNAYASYVRIHEEMGRSTPPEWRSLSHVRRMAWEAAAQAVALSVLPASATAVDDEMDDELTGVTESDSAMVDRNGKLAISHRV
jgi:hypothetical protein